MNARLHASTAQTSPLAPAFRHILLAVAIALMLSGCAQADPFEGSWAVDQGEPPLATIPAASPDGSYLVTVASGDPLLRFTLRFTRRGDVLTATREMHYPGPPGDVTRTFRFTRTADGGLTYYEGEDGLTLAELRLQRVTDPVAPTAPASEAAP